MYQLVKIFISVRVLSQYSSATNDLTLLWHWWPEFILYPFQFRKRPSSTAVWVY